MRTALLKSLAAAAALLLAPAAAAQVGDDAAAESSGRVNYEALFDSHFGTQPRAPRDYNANYGTPLEQRIAQLAEGSQGRIGVAAVDLSTGQSISVLGNQAFPMASTSKIAIAATYLEMVDQGRLSLTSEYPLRMAVRSARFSTPVAPVRDGEHMTALQLIDLMLTRSSNPATDALLAAVGGVGPVNAWARRAGIEEFNLTRDIATLVRDDGEFDPATHIDIRDSSTPQAMVELLTGIYQGRWLSASSRAVIVDAMERCATGTRRIPALMPENVRVAHKTGSLSNTSSDIGIITAPDGRAIAVAIYVTGQGTRANREARIAQIARAIYDGYVLPAANDNGRVYASADYPAAGS